jgi:hypothetical protein
MSLAFRFHVLKMLTPSDDTIHKKEVADLSCR